jgi:hypothetical protein
LESDSSFSRPDMRFDCLFSFAIFFSVKGLSELSIEFP